MRLEGQLVDATLSLTSVHDAGANGDTVTIVGTLNDDSTMDGTITGRMGAMKWTAERLGRERRGPGQQAPWSPDAR